MMKISTSDFEMLMANADSAVEKCVDLMRSLSLSILERCGRLSKTRIILFRDVAKNLGFDHIYISFERRDDKGQPYMFISHEDGSRDKEIEDLSPLHLRRICYELTSIDNMIRDGLLHEDDVVRG